MKGSFLAEKGEYMEFFNSAVGTLQTLVVALGAALCVWGGINLLEGYGNDNRAMRSWLKRSGAETEKNIKIKYSEVQ